MTERNFGRVFLLKKLSIMPPVSRLRLGLMIVAKLTATTIGILTGSAFNSAATAEAERPNFYTKDISDDWSVFGRISIDPASIHDTCSAQRLWPDGSYFQIRKDLTDNSIYLWMKINDWDIRDKADTKYNVQINAFDKNNRWLDGSGLTFSVINKNSVYSINLIAKPFLTAMMASSHMKFVMPGSVQNVTVDFNNLGTQLISALSECISSSKTATLPPNAEIPNLDSPRAIKPSKL